MRVICSTINGNDVEGEVIDGRFFDVQKDSYDLNEMFTLRRDNGEVLEVHGWLVYVTVLDPVSTYKMWAYEEEAGAKLHLLSLREHELVRSWSLRDLLQDEASGRERLRWSAGASTRT